ncbi:hypothetical protein ACMD2_14241 [Ananas comosus]|uniref:Uncharacterized protein n=1 Tax=Ananas comosus TaxID=4615 RepID=A0A199VW97_ANACO|nr:hypothetical protein ACMD2_14241 [Ananas comosus]
MATTAAATTTTTPSSPPASSSPSPPGPSSPPQSSPAPPSPSLATSPSSSAPSSVARRRGGGEGGEGGGGADPSGPLVSVDNLRAYLQIIDVAFILGLDHDIAGHAFELFRDCSSATCLMNHSVEALTTNLRHVQSEMLQDSNISKFKSSTKLSGI